MVGRELCLLWIESPAFSSRLTICVVQEGVYIIAENLIPEAREAIKETPIFDWFCHISDIKNVIFY